MSHDLLEKIVKKSVKSKSSIDDIVVFFESFHKGEYIYPSVVKRNFNLEVNEVYKILSSLEQNDFLKIYYEFFCYTCNSCSQLFEYFSQLKESYICNICEQELSINNVKVVYKVIK